VQARPLFSIYIYIYIFYFSETKPVWALEARRSPRLGASERARRSGRRSTPDSLRAGALARRLIPLFFFNRVLLGQTGTGGQTTSAPQRAQRSKGASGALGARRPLRLSESIGRASKAPRWRSMPGRARDHGARLGYRAIERPDPEQKTCRLWTLVYRCDTDRK
jgi:hypothetical protein